MGWAAYYLAHFSLHIDALYTQGECPKRRVYDEILAFGDLGALVSPADSVGCWTRAAGTQQPLKTPPPLKRWTKLLLFVRRSLAFKLFALETPLISMCAENSLLHFFHCQTAFAVV